jgi:dephospho-CoA kinase
MNPREILLIAIAGMTKSGKSEIAMEINKLKGFPYYEMIDPVMQSLGKRLDYIRVADILNELQSMRNQQGGDILARIATESVIRFDQPTVTVAGLRSYEDHLYFKKTFGKYKCIYIHTNNVIRYYMLVHDVSSIAKTKHEITLLDCVSYEQGIVYIVRDADYIIVNDPTFPLSLTEQLQSILGRILGANAS